MAAALLLLLGCSRLPTPPAATMAVDGLIRDPSTGIYSDSAGSERFADIPQPFRRFYAYCSNCHSNLAPNTDAMVQAKAKMNLNNWEEIVAYGPSRLVVFANAGTMPPQPSGNVPDTLIDRVIGFLASWSSGGSALQGTRFLAGKALINRLCADCHTASGRNPNQARAWQTLPMDTYAQWKKYQSLVAGRLSISHPGGSPMPPPEFPFQPNSNERGLLLDWISRNSPDTPDGAGQGTVDSTAADSIATTGGLLDVAYAPAQRIVNRYCVDCHSQGGRNKDQVDAWKNADVKLDSYAGWVKAQNTLAIRLNPALAASQTPFPLDQMPKLSFSLQPTQAERDTLLAWLKRGSPNTPTGE